MPENSWRLFIGCFVQSEALREYYHRLKTACSPWSRAKWVAPDQLHFTLAFLGEIPRSHLPELLQPLAPILHEYASPIVLRGVGVFPNWRAPRVLYIGVENPGGVLQGVYAILRDSLLAAGFTPAEKERSFVPHVTIARLKELHHADRFRKALRPYAELVFDTLPSFQPVLVRSILTPEGPLYSVISPELPAA
ncbi:RNA 2',3'-cyclic phosphodiesterase [bacterium HR21]|jgi:2'-5' RNA ligase|nr:RNA 2',3'-cyclic phosphodiesterase [bacterium HR21]